MNPRRWLVAALCLALTAAAGLADARSARSCRNWTEERRLAESQKEMNRVPVLISKAWFLGYLAGHSAAGQRDPAAGIDDESIFLWLDGYCRDHTEADLASAGSALEKELAARR